MAYAGLVETEGKRRREHGGTILIALIVFASMSVLAGLTVVSTQSTIATSRNERFNAAALYAAESGGAAAMDYLRQRVDPTTGFTVFVTANNSAPISPPGISGNNQPPGASGNPFSADMQASYRVVILNNRSDPGFAAGNDEDATVVISVTGYGPQGAVASLEWEVRADPSGVPGPFILVSWHQIL